MTVLTQLLIYSCCFFRGFGFATYTDPASVDKVLANGPHEIDSKLVSTGGGYWEGVGGGGVTWWITFCGSNSVVNVVLCCLACNRYDNYTLPPPPIFLLCC